MNRTPSEGTFKTENYVSNLNNLNSGNAGATHLSPTAINSLGQRSSSSTRIQRSFYHQPIRTSFTKVGMQRSTHLIEANNSNGPTTEIRNLATLGDDILGARKLSHKNLHFGSTNVGSARNLAIQTSGNYNSLSGQASGTMSATGGDLKKSGLISQYHQEVHTPTGGFSSTNNLKSSLIGTGKTSGVYGIDMAPRLVDVKTTQGEQKVTTIRGEPIQIEERIGEPVLISTIEKGSKVISSNYTGKQKDMLVECFQRIMLLSMENKRLVSSNNILQQNNVRLTSTIQELNIKVRSIHTFESEIHRLQQERDEFERRINTYLTERSSLILEIEKLKSMESHSFIELESKLRLLVTENERLTSMLSTAQNDSQEVHSLKLKQQEAEDKLRLLAAENERLQLIIRERDSSMSTLEKGKGHLETDLEKLLQENKRLGRELKQRDMDIENIRSEWKLSEQKIRQDYESRINEITQENKRVVDKYNSLVGEYESTKNTLSQLEIDFRSLEDKINQLNHEIKLRDIAITDKDKRISELENEKQNLQKKLEISERSLFDLRQDYEGNILFKKWAQIVI